MNDYPLFWFSKTVGQNPTERKIRAFANLEPGWRLGAGDSFSKTVLDSACMINGQAVKLGFFKTDAFPGKSGDVSVVIYEGNDRFDFRVRPNSIQFSHERDGEDVEEEVQVTLDDALNRITSIKEGQWKPFYTSTFVILNQGLEMDLGDSGQKLLRGQAMGAEFLSSIRTAFLSQPAAYADMPYTFIQAPLINLPYFGNLNRLNCSPVAHWSQNRATLVTNAI